jgi:hypothetical protein
MLRLAKVVQNVRKKFTFVLLSAKLYIFFVNSSVKNSRTILKTNALQIFLK